MRRSGPPLDLCSYCAPEAACEPLAEDMHTDAGWCASPISHTEPYSFFFGTNALSQAVHDSLLSWLENLSAWKQANGGFYLSDVLGLTDALLPPSLHAWFGTSAHALIEAHASEAFGVRLALHGPIALHRMTAGQGVGIHSDAPAVGEETHRLVLFLCRPRPLTAGGHFLLLRGDQPSEAEVVIPLRSNRFVGFALDGCSHHAITVVSEGARYSVVISFREVEQWI